MADIKCTCTDEDCRHPNSELCGKPITVKLKASVLLEPGKFGPEYEAGVCDECWGKLKGKYGFGN